ncbi:hypothetical protein KCU40_004403 [Vibrio vulnificus]|nr:hypothetical protein [Vibrio vulnificus]
MALYQNYAKELLSKLGRLNELISHAPSIGSFHENIVSSYLKNFLSRRFSVKTGFVCNPLTKEVSPQLDIIIVDENVPSAYLFQDDNFVVVTPSAVVCAIEIKTNFSKQSFRDIAKKSQQYRKSNPYPINNFLALCFRSNTKNTDTIGEWFNSIDIPDAWLDYPSQITLLDHCFFQAEPPVRAKPSGMVRIVCNEDRGVDKEEALLTNFLFTVLKHCELKDGKQTQDTIQTVFQGDFDRLFTMKHETYKYGQGCLALEEYKLTNGEVMYKREK